MPLSFPSSPAVGQTSQQNQREFFWTGHAWELVATSGGSSWVTAPEGSDSAGEAGQLAFSGGYLFVCVATSTWMRTTLESFAAQNSLLLENGDYLTTETSDPLVAA